MTDAPRPTRNGARDALLRAITALADTARETQSVPATTACAAAAFDLARTLDLIGEDDDQ